MYIEEAIEILKNSKKLYLKEKIDSDILEEAIETLLTAYEKEKEKNKELESYCNDVRKEMNEENKRCILLAVENQDLKEKNKEAIDFINKRKKTVSKDMAEGTRLQVGTFMWQVDELLEILKGEKGGIKQC